MEDIGQKTKTSLIWNVSLKVGYQVFRFAISIIIARILDPRDFGIMGIASMIILYADNLTSLGFNQALINRKEINESHINTVFTLNFSLSLLFTTAIIVFSGQIANFFQVPELKGVVIVLSCSFLISTFYQIPMTLMRRQLNFKVVALTELYRGLLQSVITLTLAMLGLKYWALAVGFVLSYVLSLIYVFVKGKWKLRIKYDHHAIKDVYSFGFWNFLRMQIAQINESADKFIIGKFLGPVLLGYYEKAFSTVALQKGSFTTQVSSVMFSSFSRLQSETDDRAKKYLTKTLSVVSLVTFPVSMGLFALSEYFVLVLLGSKWQPAIIPLKILSFAFIFNSMDDLCSSLNVGKGSYVKQIMREGCCVVILTILCLFAVNYGIEFVAVGVAFAYALKFSATFQLTRKNIDLKFKDMTESILPATIGVLLMLLAVQLSKKLFFYDINVGNLILMVITGAVTYGLAIVIPRYPVLEEYRSAVIVTIKNKFFKSASAKNN